MTERPHDAAPGAAPELPQALVKAPSRRHIPLVWIIPLVAALIGVWLVGQALLNRETVIEIRFKSAEGLEPGHTKIKYKDVEIGQVSSISFTKDRNDVVVQAKILRQDVDLLVQDTRFWVVRPRISAGNVTGLNTLLSGAYIAADVGHSSIEQREFRGLETPPVVVAGVPGRTFVLHTGEIGSLDVGAPVSFRHITVGQVVAYHLDPDGKGITLQIFVNAPYDQYVTDNTRFWQASGIEISLDAQGVRLQSESIASILEGGLAFQSPPNEDVGQPAPDRAEFRLYPDRDSALRVTDALVHHYVLYFDQSLRGLAPGAPVDFHGIVVGEVTAVRAEYGNGPRAVRFPVEIAIYPKRMVARAAPGATVPGLDEHSNQVLVDRLVKEGLRAELKSANLLTGQLYVGLDFFPQAKPARVIWSTPLAQLPTVASPGLDEIEASVDQLMTKVNKLPLNEVAENLNQSLASLNTTLATGNQLLAHADTQLLPEAEATLAQARTAAAAAEKLLASDSPTQKELQEALRQISRSAQAVAVLADTLNRHPEAIIWGKPSAERKKDEEPGAPR